MTNLNAPAEAQRRTILNRVLTVVDRKFMGADPDTAALRDRHEGDIVRAEAGADFEDAMNRMLRDLGASHVGFFHDGTPRAAGRVAIAATFTKADTSDGHRWVFQDVHPGGVADAAGVRPGDVLLTIGGKEYIPPAATPFALGETYDLTVRRADGSTAAARLTVPGSSEKKRPMVVPERVVTATKLADGIGLIRISMFPGVLGIDVARDINRAVADLACDRLIFDLRGNTGGGIGCLRVMSHLCSDRRGVGYSVTRDMMKNGFDKNRLPAFDRIPSSKLGVFPLVFRFVIPRRRSVAVFTEQLGDQPHHGRVVMLVNEHSASASEMVAAFAAENSLATLVGTRTAGRLVASSAFKVGEGYRVVLPVAAFFTWAGTNLEGRGIEPTHHTPLSVEGLWSGEDNQLAHALSILSGGRGEVRSAV
jgi:C-terminal processing protease CtpA/Prc